MSNRGGNDMEDLDKVYAKRIAKEYSPKKVYILSFIFLLAINLSLIEPAIFLVTNNKNVVAGQITSIAMATYFL